jgi:FAD/FMN-containing dehydrogenase
MVTETIPTTRAIAQDAITALIASLRGDVIQPGDAGYDTARTVYNAMIDRYPALIVRCQDVADVIAGVNFAREQGLLLAVRGGGHNGAGLGTVDDGLVLDLGLMNGVRVDPIARTARVEGGALLSDLHHATAPFGLAMPSGIVASTGVGGITLGGGIGHLTRQLGLTIDNLLEADVVLADERRLRRAIGCGEESCRRRSLRPHTGGRRLRPVGGLRACPQLLRLDVPAPHGHLR